MKDDAPNQHQVQPSRLREWLLTLSPGLRIAWEFLTPAQQQAEWSEYERLAREAVEKTRKFALLAFREHFPKEELYDADNALLRGIGEKAYRAAKQRGNG